MDKFSFGNYSTPSETVFAETKGYVNPSGEQETRYQLSKPLVEVKDYINKTVAVDGNNNAIQLSVRDDTIKYRTTESGEWSDVISGSTIPDTETIATSDRLTFYDTSKEKVAKSSIQFGSNANKYLRNDGTWQSVSSLGFIDTSNIIDHFENTNNSIIQKSYTATQDCYAVGGPAGSILFVTVNNVPVSNALTAIPLKAGQTIVCALDGSRPSPYRDLTIYGIN